MHDVIKFVKNHHATGAIYASHTDLRLITPCATRFATHVIVAMRMLKVLLDFLFFSSKQVLLLVGHLVAVAFVFCSCFLLT